MDDNQSKCWRQIGVWGDRSCTELKNYTHCHNCPVYSTSGRNLLEREAPLDYITEWTQLIAGEKAKTNGHSLQKLATFSVIIFRLGGEWLALPANLFKEVNPVSYIHKLPHRSNSIFLGLVNIRGELQMCISLKAFLGIDAISIASQNSSHVVYKRMVIVEKSGKPWVFPVDEIYGIHRLSPEELRNVPANVSKSTNTYTKAMIPWQDKNVSYLDDELLFYTIERRVL
ncbi:MAG TPA: chemotaxis protein CheW [Oculatellaceae cyanobacterium]|jgi:chemotaxis-related protein WspD